MHDTQGFEDKFIQLERKGEIRVGKLVLLDDLVRSIINSISQDNEKATVILISTFVKILAGGSKSKSEEWEEINKMADELLDKLATREGITMKETLKVFEEIMKYANSEHNYMFIRRTSIAESEVEEAFKEGELGV